MEKDNKTPARNASHSEAGGQNKIVQTYAEDMANVLENDTEGLVKKIIHGEEKHEQEKKNLSPRSKKNRFFMFISILFVMLALAIFSFFFFRKNANIVSVEKQFTPIIFNDQSAYLEVSGLNKDEIGQTVLNEINTSKVKNGGLEGIYPTVNQQIVGLREFISLIKSNFTPSNDLSLVSDNFLMGVVKNPDTQTNTGTGFFILLKVRSIADIFDSMRLWENNLLTDLHGFLGVNISSDTNYLFTKNFIDGIVENKNARVLYDNSGNIVLMYIFADDNSVIITDSSNAAHEILLRLASSQVQQ